MGKSVDRKQVDDYKLSLVRFRDVVKKNFDGIELVVLGLELQEHIHYGMPLRTMIYDSLGYLKEFEGVRKGSRLLCVKHGKSIMMKQDRMGLSLVKNRDLRRQQYNIYDKIWNIKEGFIKEVFRKRLQRSTF